MPESLPSAPRAAPCYYDLKKTHQWSVNNNKLYICVLLVRSLLQQIFAQWPTKSKKALSVGVARVPAAHACRLLVREKHCHTNVTSSAFSLHYHLSGFCEFDAKQRLQFGDTIVFCVVEDGHGSILLLAGRPCTCVGDEASSCRQLPQLHQWILAAR